jgi:hypothetical protein
MYSFFVRMKETHKAKHCRKMGLTIGKKSEVRSIFSIELLETCMILSSEPQNIMYLKAKHH